VFYAKNFIWPIRIAGCPGLSPAISAQFTLGMEVTTENCKKTLKSLNV